MSGYGDPSSPFGFNLGPQFDWVFPHSVSHMGMRGNWQDRPVGESSERKCAYCGRYRVNIEKSCPGCGATEVE